MNQRSRQILLHRLHIYIKPPVLMAMFAACFLSLSESAEESAQERKHDFPQDHTHDDAGKKRETDMGQDLNAPDDRKEPDCCMQNPSSFVSVICKRCDHKDQNK